MTTGNLEQKVRQLDNVVHAINELIFKISTTQERHTNRLAELTEDVAAIRASVAALTEDAAAISASVAAHDARFDALEGRVDRVLEILERPAD